MDGETPGGGRREEENVAAKERQQQRRGDNWGELNTACGKIDGRDEDDHDCNDGQASGW